MWGQQSTLGKRHTPPSDGGTCLPLQHETSSQQKQKAENEPLSFIGTFFFFSKNTYTLFYMQEHFACIEVYSMHVVPEVVRKGHRTLGNGSCRPLGRTEVNGFSPLEEQ